MEIQFSTIEWRQSPAESLRMFIQWKRCVVLVDCWIKFKYNTTITRALCIEFFLEYQFPNERFNDETRF